MTLRRTIAPLALLAALVLAGCGGGESAEQAAKDEFGAYTTAEVGRSTAENGLNRAFRDISRAARARDRAAVVAAARRGQRAAATIRRSLATELVAATALAEYTPTHGDAEKLGRALRRSRDGLARIERQLEIAVEDPFLEQPANADEVSRLSQESVGLSVDAAFARREATRAIATTLGVEPPFDVRYDVPLDSPEG